MYKIDNPKYKEARERAARLVKEMTLEEKVIQLTQFLVDENEYNPDHVEEDGEPVAGRCGSVLGTTGAEKVNRYQQISMECTPKGIPLISGCDMLHGCCTTMPIPLAQSCAFEPDLVRRCAAVIGRESRLQGVHWVFAPMVDIARDARWGRVAEGFGEDPYVASKMAEASVRGFQDDGGVMACLKHYVGYSACEGGRDYNGCDMSDQTLFNTYLPPFKAGIDAGAATVMSSFNEINGVPCSGSRKMLTDVLRGALGFDGFVISDYDAIPELINHGYAEDERDAVLKGYGAGVDVLMIGNLFNRYLPSLVKEGKISEAQIDASCERVLAAKYTLGVMDEPMVDVEKVNGALLTEEYRAVARDAARRSFVLLENDGILPLIPSVWAGKKIGLTGPLANDGDQVLGCWAALKNPDKTVKIKDAMERAYPDSEIVFTDGVCFKKQHSNPDESLEILKGCDVIVACMGEAEHESGEAASKTSLDLPRDQLDCLEGLFSLGVPVVLLITAGRPLVMTDLAERASAILYIWAPGTECGNAVCDALTGAYNPSGKTTVSFPRRSGQCPVYYNCKPTGRPTVKGRLNWRFESKYIDCPIGALYPFGYGKSYTTFGYSDAAISAPEMKRGGSVTVSCKITNTGKYPGEEVVQLYVRDVVASLTRPVCELKGFEKIYLEPGESKTVSFTLTEESLAFYNADMERVAESGKFTCRIAPDSFADAEEFEFTLL